MKLFVRGLLAAIALVAASPERATAQPSDYPNRAVSFIVPFAPGGVTSLFARVLGSKLEQRLGKPFVVENRPGGGGVLAASAARTRRRRRPSRANPNGPPGSPSSRAASSAAVDID